MYDVSVRELQPARLATLRHAGSLPGNRPYLRTAVRLGHRPRTHGSADSGDRRLLRRSRRRGRQGSALRCRPGSSAPRSPSMATSASSRFPAAAMRCCTTAGPYAELNKAYRWPYREWLPSERRAMRRPSHLRRVPQQPAHPPARAVADRHLPAAGRALSKTPGNLPRPALFNFSPQSVIWLTFASERSPLFLSSARSLSEYLQKAATNRIFLTSH
jgi:hypothetical protein